MKPNYLTIAQLLFLAVIAVVLLLPALTSAQQLVTNPVKYTYDAAGNRIKREQVLQASLLIQNPNNNQQHIVETPLAEKEKAAAQPLTGAAIEKEPITPVTEPFSSQSLLAPLNKPDGRQQPDERIETLKVNVFPNPTRGKIFLTASAPITFLEIFNVLGEQVYNSTNKHIHQSAIIDMSGFVRGGYFLRIETEEGSRVEKVILQ